MKICYFDGHFGLRELRFRILPGYLSFYAERIYMPQ